MSKNRFPTRRDKSICFFFIYLHSSLAVKFYHALVATIMHHNDRITETNKSDAGSGAPLRLIKAFPVFFFYRSIFHLFLGLHIPFPPPVEMGIFIADLTRHIRGSLCLDYKATTFPKFLLRTETIQSRRCPDINAQIVSGQFLTTAPAQRKCSYSAISYTSFEIFPFDGL